MPAVKPLAMTFADFAKAKQSRTRQSAYRDFILALKPREVVDATAAFPEATADTVRSALYAHAKRLNRALTSLTQDGHLMVALTEAPPTTPAPVKK